MSVLAFRHVPFEHLGTIEAALQAARLPFEYVDLHEAPDRPVDLDAASALVFMGGPMSANDNLPYLVREMHLIEEAIRAGKPVLGVCLGAQLIAKAAGARVYRNPAKEIGWFDVAWTPAGRNDPLFAGLRQPQMVFHWHGETFDLPASAEWLAASSACRNQAFRLESSAYALQFHLEVTPEMIAAWCAEDANSADVRELAAPIDPCAHSFSLAEAASLVFSRWARLAAGRARD